MRRVIGGRTQERPQALLLGRIEQAFPRDPALPATSASQLERSAITGAASSAAATSAGVASATVPTMSSGTAGLTTGRGSPPPVRGAASQWCARHASRAAISPATDRRPERRPLTVTTGVWPRRPQVRPLGGLRVNPASSSKQM